MKLAIYPGTFDPITNGHIDVLEKAVKMFDKVILAVADYTGKNTIFDLEKRVEICRKALQHLPNVEVMPFHGLVVEFAKKVNARVMIRGLRAVSDFEYELSQALMNKKLNRAVDTVFFVPDNKYLYLSSTMVRQVVELGGDLKDMIPDNVEQELLIWQKQKKNKENRRSENE
ncbi:MAG TPA: pantetheine-phosphate adenylyltransferase [Candidatus Cloacimonadota bacterium]|nr:pantetheine-phosphate adenylyltransferase [Candidatus Cloacimonadota bacterium]